MEAANRALLFLWGCAQFVKQSPVMGGGWSGLGGDLLTVVTNPLNPDPRIPSWGGRESEKEKYEG